MSRLPQPGTQATDRVHDGLLASVAAGIEHANRSGRSIVASAGVELDPATDVAAAVFASRRAEDRYFVWEQPDRDAFALGGVGVALSVEVGGQWRFREAARRCAEVMQDAVLEGPCGRAPLWVGGFSFAAGGAGTPPWSSLPEGLLVLPELCLLREQGRCLAVLSTVCRPGSEVDSLVAAAQARLGGLRSDPIPMQDPDPTAGYSIASTLPPGRYETIVAHGRDRIREGELDKVVLAREVDVEAPSPFKAAAVFDGLRQGYPSCYCYCVGTPEVAFVGASPELLLRREGSRVSTVALAGSARRSADPAVDDHLGERLRHSSKDLEEHRIVAERIEDSLDRLSVWVAAADEPVLVKIANIQHLATPLRAQLSQPLSAVELAGELHPTPAVGGEPWARARSLIAELEELDRGWYAAPVGWMDAAEDGEFCVALRCALLEGRTAHCYAGVGVVGESDPEAELAETEVKLGAVLPALTGG